MKATILSVHNETQEVSNALVVAPSQEEIIQKIYALYGPKGTLAVNNRILEIKFINLDPTEEQPTDYPIAS